MDMDTNKMSEEEIITYTFSFQPGNWYAPSPTCDTMEGRQDPVKVLSEGRAKASCKIQFLTNTIFRELPYKM
jgi:hypothetical protein